MVVVGESDHLMSWWLIGAALFSLSPARRCSQGGGSAPLFVTFLPGLRLGRAAMPGLAGATLVALPRQLHRTLATKRELHGRAADISESVVHTAMMGLLLMTSEVS